jgi:general secretion pathway protein K
MNLRVKIQKARGIALIMVMLIVTALAFLAFALATSMKVETTLARNTSWDMELEWLGRSGIELAKYYLAQPRQGPQLDAPNQLWAGGTAETNDALAGLSLKDNHLGHGTFSVTITDEDRKFNINLAALMAPEILDQGLILMGVDGAEATGIRNAIVDWIDKDDKPSMGSSDTESSYYESLPQPHVAKNGFIDDLTELMSIKGITPAMYFGPGGGAGTGNAAQQMFTQSANRFNRRQDQEPAYAVGLADLFTSVGLTVNFNFASATVMQLFPAIDASDAQAIIDFRIGPNKTEGDDDDVVYSGPGVIADVPNLKQSARDFLKSPGAARYISGASTTFQVQVDAQIDQVKRTYYALLRRTGPNQVALLYMYWR